MSGMRQAYDSDTTREQHSLISEDVAFPRRARNPINANAANRRLCISFLRFPVQFWANRGCLNF